MNLSIKSVIGYGAGDLANNLAFTLGTTFLLLYYTDVVGISAAAVGTMFLIVRLWDAFADLFAGRIVDRTMTRWGKFRPFIIFGGGPLLFLSVLTFAVPQGLGDGTKLLYAYLTYAALGLVYSLVNVPYGSLATAMTQLPRERAKLATARGLGAGLGGLLLTFIIAPQIQGVARDQSLTATDRAAGLQSIFFTTTLIFVGLGFALYLLTFLWCRETVVRTQDRVSVRDTVRTLRTNKALGILCGSSFFYLIGMFAVGGATAYYAIYVLGDARYIIWMTLVTVAVQFASAPFIPRLVTRFGKKNLYQYCGFFTVIGGVALFFTPAQLPLLALLFVAVKGLGVQLINTLMFALEADTVEYGEWQTGRRTEGTTYAIFSFTRKVTQSIGGALGAFALALGGYLTTLGPGQVQPDSAILAIKASLGLVPAAAALLAMVVFVKYPLTEKRFGAIVEETARRRSLPVEPVAPVPVPLVAA